MGRIVAKRFVAFLMVAALVVALLPVMGETVEAKAAVGQSFEQGDFIYEVISDKYEVKLLSLKEGVPPTALNGLYIPDCVTNPYDKEEYRVTVIGDLAFNGYRNIKGQLRLPEYLDTIGPYAFAYCTGLYGELIIPDGCTRIDDEAFLGDYKFTSLRFGQKPIINYIGAQAFANCYGLSGEFELPESVCEIGYNAFRYTGFDTFIIPEYMTKLQYDRINGGKPWDKIINNSDMEFDIDKLLGKDHNNPGYYNYISSVASTPVTVISKGAYKAVINQDYIKYRKISDEGFKIDVTSSEKGEAWITGIIDPYKSDITIPGKVTIDSVEYKIIGIDSGAFENMPISGNLTIENGIETINEYAFFGCVALDGKLVIPDSLKTIEYFAFSYAGISGDLILNEGLESIGNGAFSDCNNINGNIILPTTLKSIGNCIFSVPIIGYRINHPYLSISISMGRSGAFIIPKELYTNGCEIDAQAFREFYPYTMVNYSETDLTSKGFNLNECIYYTRALHNDGSADYTETDNLKRGAYYREKSSGTLPYDTPVGWLPDKIPCNSTAESLTEYLNNLAAEETSEGKFTLNDSILELVSGNNSIFLTYEPYELMQSKIIDYQWNVELTHVAGEAKKENEVAATCTTDGSYDLVTYCSECGVEISRETIPIEKLGHLAGEAKKENEVAATCSKTGSYDMVTCCDRCGEELSRESFTTDKLPHTPGNWETIYHATETTTGKKVRKCTVCGEVVEEEIIPTAAPAPTLTPGNGNGNGNGNGSGNGTQVPGGVVDNPGSGVPIVTPSLSATPTVTPTPTNLPKPTPKVTQVPDRPDVTVKERPDGTIVTTTTNEVAGVFTTIKEAVRKDGSRSDVFKREKADGSVEKVTRETSVDGEYIETAILKDADGNKVILTFTSKDGEKATLSEILSSSSEVKIPAEVPGADGKMHKITALAAGVVSDTAKSVVLSSAIKTLKKNALRGLADLTSVKLSEGTTLGKNCLKDTGAKLVLNIVVSKDATKQERKAAKKSIGDQLKKAGNAKAKVKIVTE